MPLQELKEQIQEEIEANPALELVSDASTVSLESLPEGEPRESEDASPFENSSDPGFSSLFGLRRRFQADVHRGGHREARDPAGAPALAAPPPAHRRGRDGPSARPSSRTSTTMASIKKTPISLIPEGSRRPTSTRSWPSCAPSSRRGPAAPTTARASSSRPSWPGTPPRRPSPSSATTWSSSRRASTPRSRSG